MCVPVCAHTCTVRKRAFAGSFPKFLQSQVLELCSDFVFVHTWMARIRVFEPSPSTPRAYISGKLEPGVESVLEFRHSDMGSRYPVHMLTVAVNTSL